MMITVKGLREALSGLDEGLELDITEDPMDDLRVLLYYPNELNAGDINVVAAI